MSAGERQCMPVLLATNGNPVASMGFSLIYPTASLRIIDPATDVERGPALGAHELDVDRRQVLELLVGRLRVIVRPPPAIPVPRVADGEILRVCFTVPADPEPGCAGVGFEGGSVDFGDDNGGGVDVGRLVGGGVQVSTSTATTTSRPTVTTTSDRGGGGITPTTASPPTTFVPAATSTTTSTRPVATTTTTPSTPTTTEPFTTTTIESSLAVTGDATPGDSSTTTSTSPAAETSSTSTTTPSETSTTSTSPTSTTLASGGPGCGNGVQEAGEECDDGNRIDGDCCASTCRIEATGVVCRASTTTCDIPERCDGSQPICPPDRKAPSGQSCVADPADTCTAQDHCDDGACVAGRRVCNATAAPLVVRGSDIGVDVICFAGESGTGCEVTEMALSVPRQRPPTRPASRACTRPKSRAGGLRSIRLAGQKLRRLLGRQPPAGSGLPAQGMARLRLNAAGKTLLRCNEAVDVQLVVRVDRAGSQHLRRLRVTLGQRR